MATSKYVDISETSLPSGVLPIRFRSRNVRPSWSFSNLRDRLAPTRQSLSRWANSAPVGLYIETARLVTTPLVFAIPPSDVILTPKPKYYSKAITVSIRTGNYDCFLVTHPQSIPLWSRSPQGTFKSSLLTSGPCRSSIDVTRTITDNATLPDQCFLCVP